MSTEFRQTFRKALDRVLSPAAARGLENVKRRIQAKIDGTKPTLLPPVGGPSATLPMASTRAQASGEVIPASLPPATGPDNFDAQAQLDSHLKRTRQPEAESAESAWHRPENLPTRPPLPAANASTARTPGVPSTELLKHLADAVFGKDTAKRECSHPPVEISADARAALCASPDSVYQNDRAKREFAAHLATLQPKAQAIEVHERTKLLELFYRTGLQVPGVELSGLRVHCSEIGTIELSPRKLEIAQSRVNDFFAALAGQRFQPGNVAAEAAYQAVQKKSPYRGWMLTGDSFE